MGVSWGAPPLGEDFGGIDAGIGYSSEGVGRLEVAGQWQFDSPTLHALVTARRRGASPGSQIFDIPVTQSRVCPSPLG